MQKLDLASLSKFLVPAALILVAVVYLLLRKIVISYIETRNSLRAQKKAVELRQASTAKKENVIVRKTDLFADLNPQQKLTHQQAEALLAQKKFKEAAALFESINFQRKAIDTLEFNGFISEAAEVLLRMKVPFRAGVVLERNGHFVRAAECFLMDNKKDSAARSFEKAAAKDYHLYRMAGDCFMEAGMIDNCLTAYSKLLLSDEVLKVALQGQRYDFLAAYMTDPFNASSLLPKMTGDQFRVFAETLQLLPCHAQAMSVWVQYHPNLENLSILLNRLSADAELAALFWSHLGNPFMNRLCKMLSENPKSQLQTAYAFHGNILSEAKRDIYGSYFKQLVPHGSDGVVAKVLPDYEALVFKRSGNP